MSRVRGVFTHRVVYLTTDAMPSLCQYTAPLRRTVQYAFDMEDLPSLLDPQSLPFEQAF